MLPADTPCSCIKTSALKGIILTGEPHLSGSAHLALFDRSILEFGVPVLGISYGMEIITAAHSGVIAQ
ncbi:MAG: glutamine amidotransferase-related protein [Treponema sp.]